MGAEQGTPMGAGGEHAGNRVHAGAMPEDEETGCGDAYAMDRSWRARLASGPGPVGEQVDSRPSSDQGSRRRSPGLPPLGSKDQLRKPDQAEAKRTPSAMSSISVLGLESDTAAKKTGDGRTPFALINVDLRSVPKVDTGQQMFTPDCDVKLRVYIPDLREKPFRFVRQDADAKKEQDGAVLEPLELHNFPLDVQRLHVTYEFKLDDVSLGNDKDMPRRVMEHLHNIHYFDVSRISKALVPQHDNEWALYRDDLEIYARPMSNDTLSVKIVFVVARNPMFYLINVILPVWCIVLFSFISFRFGAAELGERLQVTLTMVLTLVAFKLSVSTAKYVPITNSMNLMDWFLIAAFMVVALVALQNFLTFELLNTAPWFNIASAWALIGLWTAANAVMFIAVTWVVEAGDVKERREDEQSFCTEGFDRVSNLLTEGAKDECAIELLWARHGATACLAMETAAGGPDKPLQDMVGAERLSKLAWAVTEKKMGHSHRYTLASLGNYANVLFNLGRWGEAREKHQCVLESRQEMLGAEHPDTLASLNDLALVLWKEVKLDEAEHLHQLALAGRDKVLGAEHRDTLTSLSNLGKLLLDQGKLDASEKLQRRALTGRREGLGDQHPDTLQSFHNLALVLRSRDKLGEAEQLLRRVLAERQKALGAEHLSTLRSLLRLATVFADRGLLEEAEALFQRVLSGREKALGAQHPDTLVILNHLGNVLSNQGRLAESEQLHRRALKGRVRVLGIEHTNTRQSLNNLALVLSEQPGKHAEAEALCRRLLKVCEEALGKAHPDTLASLSNLADFLRDRGNLVEAEDMHRSALARRQKALGAEHPDTLTSCNKLADVLRDRGKLDQAEQAYRDALEGRQNELGYEHPDMLQSLHSLATVLAKQGKLGEAAQLLRRALAGREKVLGSEHPDTLESLVNLADVLRDQGDEDEVADEAAALYSRWWKSTGLL
ncbi:hypothetical protein FOA52_015511 [Chlamydomonas sp. UWO 241]|nr:hypothetical protein FOA52_015511 [Chlamydomonas sp. UWO 241]